jgi:hypothetical protein
LAFFGQLRGHLFHLRFVGTDDGKNLPGRSSSFGLRFRHVPSFTAARLQGKRIACQIWVAHASRVQRQSGSDFWRHAETNFP